MFIRYRYVDILFHPTKTIPVILEQVTSHYQTTLQTWIGYSVTRYITLTHYHMRYPTFSFCLAWYSSFCNQL